MNGKQARFDDITRLLGLLPSGVEIAMGGGDTVSYPQLEELLVWAKIRGLVMNIAVNAMHLYRHTASTSMSVLRIFSSQPSPP
ncbi:MAG: MaLMM01 [Gemmataceae bacterium]|nr:MaLMM01 [Gemmataceae bacterium]